MDADANHGDHERIMLLCVYEHTVKVVIIEDTVVDTFRGGALLIDISISICTTGHIAVKADILFGSGLDVPPIFGIHAVVFAYGTVSFSIWATAHEITAGTVITIGLHAEFSWHKGVSSLSMVMVSEIVFGRSHLSFRSMNARIPLFLRSRQVG